MLLLRALPGPITAASTGCRDIRSQLQKPGPVGGRPTNQHLRQAILTCESAWNDAAEGCASFTDGWRGGGGGIDPCASCCCCRCAPPPSLPPCTPHERG